MKIIYALSIFLMINSISFAQKAKPNDTKDHSFIVRTDIDSVHNRVVISWDADTNARNFYIRRKLQEEKEFDFEYYATLDSSALQFVDSNVSAGLAYEYGLEKWCNGYSAWNYLNVGWNIPLQEHRGRILLLIDSTLASPLGLEIEQLIHDMTGDAWIVNTSLAPRAEQFNSAKVQQTKNIILDEYIKNSDTLRAVMIIGRVPVPYSGNYAIDGHSPDHMGAWPADVYYADIDGVWTDSIISSDSSSYPRQHNFPNDGKFDNSYMPSDVELELGRVDLFDIPAFPETEIELIRNYLLKNHNYRQKIVAFDNNAVIDDKFKLYSNEAFASTAWSNFSALFPIENIDTASIRYFLPSHKYLFSYGCNSGGIGSCYLVGYAHEFTTSPPLSAFYTAFGSYFGDWDFSDNFLRSALASSETVVASFWLGRPFWHLHHLGLGESIGYSTKISQNNLLTYESTSKYGNRMVHIELLGDPTLRIHTIAPVQDLREANLLEINGIRIQWGESTDNTDGVYVYRAANLSEPFVRISDAIVQDQYFTDTNPLLGENYYQVRAIRMEHTPTGSFWNNSVGAFVKVSYPRIVTDKKLMIFSAPNPAANTVKIAINSKINADGNVSIYDLSGRIVKQFQTIDLKIGLNIIDYNLTDNQGAKIAKGSYFLYIRSNSIEDTFILIVQ